MQESRQLQCELLGSEAMAYKGQVTPFKVYKSVLLPFLRQYVPHIEEQVPRAAIGGDARSDAVMRP